MWLTDLCLVLPDRIIPRGALHIEGEHIRTIQEGDAPISGADQIINASGLTALPGAIDVHGDMLERDIEPRPGANFPIDLATYELDKRLAATGVTTAFAAVSFALSADDQAAQDKAGQIIAAINQLRSTLLVDFRIHARLEVGNPTSAPILSRLIDAGAVQLVSVMDHTPGQGQYHKIDKYVTFMLKWLGVEPEVVGEEALERIKKSLTKTDVPPRNWEAVRPILEHAYAQHIPTASHDDDSVAKIDLMAGMNVTISEFPVTLAAAQAAKARGMAVVMGAPNAYRGISTGEGNLSARDAIRAGVVDILAADYFPASLIQAAFRLAEQKILSLPDAINLISRNPAQAVGLTDRGQIAPGMQADLVLVDATDPHPRIRATFRAGHPIYQDQVMAARTSASALRSRESVQVTSL